MNGVNNDGFSHWRNTGQIGIVHLAFRVIIVAIQDFFFGDVDEVHSSAVFFEGGDNSTLKLWSSVLGVDDAPFVSLVENYIKIGEVPSKEDFDELDRIFNLMTIDYKNVKKAKA